MYKPVFWFFICNLFFSNFLFGQEIKTEVADGAILRGLDKVSGKVKDIPLYSGDTAVFGSLSVLLKDCRFPTNNPAGDAFVRLVINEQPEAKNIFDGWMIASSPALNPLDHSRYDVWALRCAMADTSDE